MMAQRPGSAKKGIFNQAKEALAAVRSSRRPPVRDSKKKGNSHQKSKERVKRSAGGGIFSNFFSNGKNHSKNGKSQLAVAKDVIVEEDAKYVAIPTAIGHWYEIRDFESAQAYFYNTLTKESLWALPMDLLFDEANADKPSPEENGWTLCIRSKTFQKFYRHPIHCVVQRKMPREFEVITRNLAYFQGSNQMQVSLEDEDFRQSRTNAYSQQVSGQKVLEKIQLTAVLENATMCAAFHRYLCAVFAEESLLFFGACVIFDKGEWHGQTVLGESLNALNEELEESEAQLYRQLRKTRVSARLGIQDQDGEMMNLKGKLEWALLLYNKFVKVDAELYVNLTDTVIEEIEENLRSCEGKPDKNLKGLFYKAQQEVYQEMNRDLFPDFVLAVIDGKEINSFEPDETVRIPLLDVFNREVKSSIRRN